MNRAHRLYHPEAREDREALRRECEVDLSVWLAANGAAVKVTFPKKEDEK